MQVGSREEDDSTHHLVLAVALVVLVFAPVALAQPRGGSP
jgi:hypothetical protein